jgi:hypothetical protein
MIRKAWWFKALLFLALWLFSWSVHADTITLDWIDNADNESGFHVYRSINEAAFEVLAILPSNTVMFGDNVARIPFEQRVCYTVDAFNSMAVSTKSNTACKVIRACQTKGKSGQCR